MWPASYYIRHLYLGTFSIVLYVPILKNFQNFQNYNAVFIEYLSTYLKIIAL